MVVVYRGMEQRLARRAHNPKVRGANPLPAIFTSFYGGIAQLVEQWNHNPLVVGSSPTAAIFLILYFFPKIIYSYSS